MKMNELTRRTTRQESSLAKGTSNFSPFQVMSVQFMSGSGSSISTLSFSETPPPFPDRPASAPIDFGFGKGETHSYRIGLEDSDSEIGRLKWCPAVLRGRIFRHFSQLGMNLVWPSLCYLR